MKPEISGCLPVNGSPVNNEEEEEEEVEVLAVMKKEQQRGKRRLSGAQKRKLRMQRALAAGEEVIARSERSQRGRIPAAVPPDSGLGNSASVKLDAFPEADSDNSELGQNTTGVPVRSYGDTLMSVRMAVVCRGFPSIKISEEQHEALQDALLDRIELSGGGQPVQVLSTRCADGAAYFVCANKWTAKWLEETVPDLSPWGGARLKAGPANTVMRLAKFLVWIPKPANRKGTPEILALLQKQNIGVPATEWKTVSRKDADDGASLVLVVDEKSFRALKGYKFKLYLGMGQVSFKILARPPGFN